MVGRLQQTDVAGGVRGDALIPSRQLPAMRNPLEDVADYLIRRNARVKEDDTLSDNLRLAEAQSAYVRRATEFMDGLDPLALDYQEQLDSGLAALADEIASQYQMALPENQARLQSALTVRRDGFATAAGSQRRAVVEGEAERLATAALDRFRARVSEDPLGYAAYKAEFDQQMEALRPSIAPERLPAFEEAVRKSGDLSIIDGLAQQGDFDQAREVLNLVRPDLSPEEYERTRRRIQTLQQERVSQAAEIGAATRAELSGRLALAQTEEELAAIEEELAIAVQRGDYVGNDSERVRIQTQITQGRRELTQRRRERTDIYTRHQSGIALDSQAQVDTAWEVHMETAAARGRDTSDPLVVANEIVEFTSRTGQVPTLVQGMMNGAEVSDDPQRLAQMAGMHEMVSLRNPYANSGAGERVKRVSSVAASLGLTTVEAANIVLDAERNPERVTARAAEFDAAPPTPEDVSSHIAGSVFNDRALGFIPWTNTLSRDDVDPTMIADYIRFKREAFALTGSMSAAEKIADRRFSETYGVSSTGGTPHIVRYPPERFLPQGLTPAQANAVLEEELARRFEVPEIGPDGRTQMVPLRGARLIPAPGSDTRVNAGLAPVYMVMAPSANLGGAYIPFMANGQPVQFTMPTERELIQNNMAYGSARIDRESNFRRSRAAERGRQLRIEMNNYGMGDTP